MSRLVFILLFAFSGSSCAVTDVQGDPIAKKSANPIVDAMLTQLHEEYRLYQARDQTSIDFHSKQKHLLIDDERILVDAVAIESAEELADELLLLGAKINASYGLIVSCFLPIHAIPQLSNMVTLKSVRPSIAETRSVDDLNFPPD